MLEPLIPLRRDSWWNWSNLAQTLSFNNIFQNLVKISCLDLKMSLNSKDITLSSLSLSVLTTLARKLLKFYGWVICDGRHFTVMFFNSCHIIFLFLFINTNQMKWSWVSWIEKKRKKKEKFVVYLWNFVWNSCLIVVLMHFWWLIDCQRRHPSAREGNFILI